MRYLNKVVFINSAAIRYAEVTLDGNVHLIGTQGVGKSTLLRAILFFYNGDTQRLGISREKKSFAEYYFLYANSYIIYEVARETGSYCVQAFKSQGKVCFRFIDSPYRRELFIGPDNHANESWDKTRNNLNSHNIDYTLKIDRYEEYRDILYGNNEGKKQFRKYALMESRQYQNIPRTIQNVFLNSKLEAEFIKQTIIMSMNEEDVNIDLTKYTHHLKDFEANLSDIQKFRQPSVQKQVVNVTDIYTQIRRLERDKKELAQQLAWAIENIRLQEPEINEKLRKEETKREKQLARLDTAAKQHTDRLVKIENQITLIDDKLKVAKKKGDEYQRMNIQQVIERVNAKSNLEREQQDLQAEKELLSARYKEVTQKYKSVIAELNNQLKEFENHKQQEKLRAQDNFLKQKEEINEYTAKLLADIRNQHEEKLRNARELVESMLHDKNAVEVEKASVRHKRFYEDEINGLQADINNYQNTIRSTENEIKHQNSRIEAAQKQWEIEEKGAKNDFENKRSRLDDRIEVQNKLIADIDLKVQNSKSSFYGWLNEQYPGWERSIGRVVDEQVLFNTALAPAMVAERQDTLYGVKIELDEISKSVKTVADYQKEKEEAAQLIEKYRKETNEANDLLAEELERLKRKYQPRIKESRDAISEGKYILEQNTERLNQARVKLDKYKTDAATARQKALEHIEGQLLKALDNLNNAKASLAKTEEELKSQLRTCEKERDKKIEQELALKNEQAARLDVEVKEKKAAHQRRMEELSNQQQAELTKKGANTKRITEIDQRLTLIRNELQFIEDSRDKVVEYNKDKREYLDKVNDFKNQKLLQEQKRQQEQEKYQLQKNALHRDLEAIEDIIRFINKEMDKVIMDLEAYSRFQETECYLSLQALLAEPKEEYRSSKRLSQLIDEVTASYYGGIKRVDEMKEAVNKFLGNFSSQNIFNFRTSLVEKNDYWRFADELSDFVEEDKISEYEKRVNERFASIIHTIGQETTNLVSREGEIQSIIHKINRDFMDKNFVGVIKKIELKMDDSVNKVVHILKLIKDFNNEYSFDLGTVNLFSNPGKQEAQNKKAVELLKLLVKEIHNFRREYISLSDSFELKFRIEENQNDTGWVEKLSNVGSEGTDILVKAMINIMLLNVFKDGASRKFRNFRLHCMMDEIGRLHPSNVRGILKFANDRNILLINGSPTENDALAYRHIYKLDKDDQSITRVKRIISQQVQV